MRKHHYIQCETQYYQEIERGFKRFELRLNDRGYEKGDLVYLEEVANGVQPGDTCPPKK